MRHREAAHHIGEPDAEGALRFGRTTLLRADGSPTYQLASAVDDVDFEITHVIRGSDHRANAELQTELIRALGGEPPEFVHHGLLLGEDGTKLSKRHGASTLADLREAGIPGEAVRAYLDELGLPKHDVHLDLARLRRLSVEALAALSDDELAARVGVPVSVVPVLRGARDLAEAREYARIVLEPELVDVERAGDVRALPRARRERGRAADGRPRAEGGRRRPEGAAARAHRSRARPGARRGHRRAAAGRAPAPDRRLGAMRLYNTLTRRLEELPAPPGADPDVLLRADRLPARAHRQRAAVRSRHVAAHVAASARLRRDARPQHHRRERQDLRGGAERERGARRARDRVVSPGHRRPRPRHARRAAEGDGGDAADRRASSSSWSRAVTRTRSRATSTSGSRATRGTDGCRASVRTRWRSRSRTR